MQGGARVVAAIRRGELQVVQTAASFVDAIWAVRCSRGTWYRTTIAVGADNARGGHAAPTYCVWVEQHSLRQKQMSPWRGGDRE
jgi:hypothetical protein